MVMFNNKSFLFVQEHPQPGLAGYEEAVQLRLCSHGVMFPEMHAKHPALWQ